MINLDNTQKTPNNIILQIAKNMKSIRKRKKLTQIQLSEKSGVSFGSIKRFETSGNISLISLSKLALVLEYDEDLSQLFTRVTYDSIEEVINEQG